ncbi:MAG: thrombospondin type 3 repeat-containing protein [Oceanococcus sp.]
MKLSSIRAFSALILASVLSFPASALIAPSPASGTLQSEGDQLAFVGGPIVGANPSPSTGSPLCLTKAIECEVYTITVAPSSASDISARITIEWSDSTNDLDIYLINEAGEIVGQSATGANPEVFEVNRLPPGDYEVQIIPYTAIEIAYTGLVEHLGEARTVTFPPGTGSGVPRVIVGVIDSAINPYHEFYYQGGPNYPHTAPNGVTPEVLAELGVKPENHITLTRSGIIDDDIEADRAFWDRVEAGELYWFVGTNVVAVSHAASGQPLLVPHIDKSPHGVGTSSAVLKANPDAVLLFVETHGALANDASHDLTFLHPAVDIISTSYGAGIPFAPIGTGAFLPEVSPFHNSYKAAVTMGKLHFSSGGNMPGFTPGRAGAGPWWSVGVSGNEEGTSEGRTTTSGNFPDFLSDFTQELARCMDCESGLADYSGTSFSTPRAAGIASRVLLEARRKVGHQGGIRSNGETMVMAEGGELPINNWLLRRALEQAAYLPDPLDYDPVSAVLDDLGAQPFNPLAPWLQTAWGDLTADPSKGVVEAALTHLGLAYRPREKSSDFCNFQTAIILERKQYWDLFTGLTPAVDPFIYCANDIPLFPASNDPGGSFDAAGDADADGIPNADDNCPEHANQDQMDQDGDGYGDACDAPPPDADADGVIDDEDNCPVTGNADQQDTGGDGIGDACETPPHADAEPGPGRVLVATFDGAAGPITTPVTCLNPCGSGNDSFASFEFRYQLPDAYSYEQLEYVLTSQMGTQYNLRLFGPDAVQIAMQGTDILPGGSGGAATGGIIESGDEAISDGELNISVDNPDTGLYLAIVQEQLSGANLPFTLEVYVTCPDGGCEAGNNDPLASRSNNDITRGGALSWLMMLSLGALILRRRRPR